jgi:hypothetical protein
MVYFVSLCASIETVNPTITPKIKRWDRPIGHGVSISHLAMHSSDVQATRCKVQQLRDRDAGVSWTMHDTGRMEPQACVSILGVYGTLLLFPAISDPVERRVTVRRLD